ncbi:hypothetical protein FF100_25880 [Methylobacterium terricola]|uniref:Uncharacterized protein n=1 Tax=Methylobacterium terricola TaxID=2583531 RepID=A0A5C4LB77_9HYPH|nr:hypothetical protein FF100_25880 [Methylobacterium terricola]
MVGLQRRSSADIIPFRAASRPRAGRVPAVFQEAASDGGGSRETGSQETEAHAADAVRGTILLFTGVRYERLPDAAEPGLPAPERRCRG